MFFSSYNKRTVLCDIMAKHGSDKGGYEGIGRHNYTVYYHQLLSDIRNSVKSVFEFGIGSTCSHFTHNMGSLGKPGASLRGWREYFYSANIYAADIDKTILQPEDRIFKFFCDQTSLNSIEALWQNSELVHSAFDVIIEDGLHVFEAQHLFMKNSLHKLKDNGLYICEDVRDDDFNSWTTCLKDLSEEHPDKTFELIKIYNQHNNWNSIIVIK